ncbi:antitoxin VbhA family protein [Acidisphaera sp. L21]|uniref:antitoxin VbhA family protein n=1 Tax=Acidisphaera sp. L21 TaxID=1641851 RepID=UPI00131B7EA0|nr:antitoxin VbhA family protein [Acidisphaera sp. L21]
MNQTKQQGRPLSAGERARRKKAIDYARGSVRLEGFVLDDAAEALFACYVQGEIDRRELDAAVAGLAASYG